MKRIFYIIIFVLTILSISSCETIKVESSEFSIIYPNDRDSNIPLSFDIEINDSDFNNAITYDVYLNGEFKGSFSSTMIHIEGLEADNEYVLTVIRKALGKKIVNRAFSKFHTTRKPEIFHIVPKNGEKYFEGTNFSWYAKDPDGDKLHYDVYLGENKDKLTLIASNLEVNEFTPTKLIPGKSYAWKLRVRDDKGASTESNIYTFKTFLPQTYSKLYGINSKGLWKMDVSDINNIKRNYLGKLDGMENFYEFRGIAYHNGYLFVEKGGDNRLLVYKAAKNGDYQKIDEQETVWVDRIRYEKGYVIGDWGGGYFIYDVNTRSILQKKWIDTGNWSNSSVSIDGNYVMIFGGGGNIWTEADGRYKLWVYDKSLNLVSYYEGGNMDIYPKSALLYNKKLYMVIVKNDGTYLYKYDFYDPNSFDISSPEKSVKLENEKRWWIQIYEEDGNVLVLDISIRKLFVVDPDNLSIIETADEIWRIKKMSLGNMYIATSGGEGCYGLKLLDSDLNEISSYDENDNGERGKAQKIISVKDYVYVEDSWARDEAKRILIYDKSLNFIKYFPESIGDLKDWKVYKDYLIAIVNGRVELYDITDASSPILKSNSEAISEPRRISVSENDLYVLSRNYIYIFDLTKLPVLKQIANFPIDIDSWNFASGGGILIIGNGDNGYEFINVSDPKNPKVVLRKDRESDNYASLRGEPIIIGKYAYLLAANNNDCGDWQLKIFDISNSSSPKKVGFYPMKLCCSDYNKILNYKDFILLNPSRDRVIILDISNRTSPIKINDFIAEKQYSFDVNETDGIYYSTREEYGIYAYSLEDIMENNDDTNDIHEAPWFSIFDVAVGE